MSVGRAFLLSLAVTVGMQLLCFVIAATLKFDKITDLAGSLNFVVVAVMTLLMAPYPLTARAIVVTSLVCVSRLELAGFLLYRVLKRGKDARFDQVREKCCVFFVFWVWQMLWVYVVSASVIYINAAGDLARAVPLGGYDYVGWGVFVFGFFVQVWSDLDKYNFRADPANSKKVCGRGLWKWSRHPNFCGELLMWVGIYVAGAPVFFASPPGWATLVSPLFTLGVLTLFTGIPQAEGKNSKRWFDGGAAQAQYESYFETTSPFWLFPPQLYALLPTPLRCLLCCELPMYADQSSQELDVVLNARTEAEAGYTAPNSEEIGRP